MARVLYDYVVASVFDLSQYINEINQNQDKIIAVTQHGNDYTVFYERNGNESEGCGDG